MYSIDNDKSVIFSILREGHGCFRIITNHMMFRKYNSSCICDIDVLYDSMSEISNLISKEYNINVLFDIID